MLTVQIHPLLLQVLGLMIRLLIDLFRPLYYYNQFLTSNFQEFVSLEKE